LRIVIDIKDEAVTKLGSIYIHNPQYNAANVAVFLPGFEYTTKTPESAIKIHILKSPLIKEKNSLGDNKEGQTEEQKSTEPLSIATPETCDCTTDDRPEEKSPDIQKRKKG